MQILTKPDHSLSCIATVCYYYYPFFIILLTPEGIITCWLHPSTELPEAGKFASALVSLCFTGNVIWVDNQQEMHPPLQVIVGLCPFFQLKNRTVFCFLKKEPRGAVLNYFLFPKITDCSDALVFLLASSYLTGFVPFITFSKGLYVDYRYS